METTMTTERRRRNAKPMALFFAAAVLLTACAGLYPPGQQPSPVLQAGQGLKAAGVEFLETANLYDGLYRAKRVTEAQYEGWRKASADFQKGYAAAFATWTAAVDKQDQSGAAQGLAVVDALRAQVLKFALGVSPAVAPRAELDDPTPAALVARVAARY